MRPILNIFDLLRIHSNAFFRDDEAEEFYFFLFEKAFLRFEEEIIFLQSFQHFIDDSSVFLEILSEDEDIVHVDDDMSLVNEVLQNGVHHSLERSGGIGESEEHDRRFKAASICSKGSFPFVSFFDAKIVITPPKIHFGEVFRTSESVDEFGDEGKGIIILNSMRVKISIILAWL